MQKATCFNNVAIVFVKKSEAEIIKMDKKVIAFGVNEIEKHKFH